MAGGGGVPFLAVSGLGNSVLVCVRALLEGRGVFFGAWAPPASQPLETCNCLGCEATGVLYIVWTQSLQWDCVVSTSPRLRLASSLSVSSNKPKGFILMKPSWSVFFFLDG